MAARRDTHRQLSALAHSPGKFRVHRLMYAAVAGVRIRRSTLGMSSIPLTYVVVGP